MRTRAILVVTRRLAALGLLAALAAPSSVRGAEDWVVVVNPESGLRSLARDDLARIFLGKKTLWEDKDTRIAPALLEENNVLTRQFLESTLRKSVSQYRAYWKRLLFSGGGAAPKTFRQSSQVLDFVARQPGGIGVIEASAVDDRVRRVDITD